MLLHLCIDLFSQILLYIELYLQFSYIFHKAVHIKLFSHKIILNKN